MKAIAAKNKDKKSRLILEMIFDRKDINEMIMKSAQIRSMR
jgi:hypothetical protein